MLGSGQVFPGCRIGDAAVGPALARRLQRPSRGGAAKAPGTAGTQRNGRLSCPIHGPRAWGCPARRPPACQLGSLPRCAVRQRACLLDWQCVFDTVGPRALPRGRVIMPTLRCVCRSTHVLRTLRVVEGCGVLLPHCCTAATGDGPRPPGFVPRPGRLGVVLVSHVLRGGTSPPLSESLRQPVSLGGGGAQVCPPM